MTAAARQSDVSLSISTDPDVADAKLAPLHLIVNICDVVRVSATAM